jgi:ADP-heptose:LPS heptosyltransferase
LRRVYLNKPEIIINLVIRKSYFQILRDRVFFSIFIPNKKIGFKYLKIIKTVENNNLMYENISVKVARLLDDKFKIDLEKAENWTINNEFESTQSLGFGYNQKYIVISVGGKYDTQQWGDENWKLLLNKLAENYNTLNFVFIGSKDEGLRVNNIIPIKFLSRFHNLCGVTTPKNGANIIRNSILFLGQDSGPMHLSASVNHDSILIHSARTLPGEWFPLNGNNYIFYNRVSCYGCYSKICTKYNKKCIAEISVEDVFQKIKNKISK